MDNQFVRLGTHSPLLSRSKSSLGTNNSAYPQSKQTTIFWIKLTGARFSFSIERNATENSPEKSCCFSEAQLLQAIPPPIRSTSRRIFSLPSLFHSVKHFWMILGHLSSLARDDNVGLNLFTIESFRIDRPKSLYLLTVFVCPFTGQV